MVLKKKVCLAFPISCTSAHTEATFPQSSERVPFLHLYVPHKPLTAQGETQPEMRCRALFALNSSCQSGACISCFGFFPGGFDVNPFHTSSTSVLLQAFKKSSLSIQIYMWKKIFLAVTVQFLKGDFIDSVLSTSPHWYTVLSTQDAVCESQWF